MKFSAVIGLPINLKIQVKAMLLKDSPLNSESLVEYKLNEHFRLNGNGFLPIADGNLKEGR